MKVETWIDASAAAFHVQLHNILHVSLQYDSAAKVVAYLLRFSSDDCLSAACDLGVPLSRLLWIASMVSCMQQASSSLQQSRH